MFNLIIYLKQRSVFGVVDDSVNNKLLSFSSKQFFKK